MIYIYAAFNESTCFSIDAAKQTRAYSTVFFWIPLTEARAYFQIDIYLPIYLHTRAHIYLYIYIYCIYIYIYCEKDFKAIGVV